MSDRGSPTGASQISPKLQSFTAPARQLFLAGPGNQGTEQSAKRTAVALDFTTRSGPTIEQGPNLAAKLTQGVKEFPVQPMFGGGKGLKVRVKI